MCVIDILNFELMSFLKKNYIKKYEGEIECYLNILNKKKEKC